MVRMVNVDIPEEDLRQDVLREAIAGRVPTIPSSVALTMLSDIDIPDVEPAVVLREVVRNEELESHVRIGAVRVYARVAGENSIPDLLAALESAEDGIAAAAATALANVGTPDQLDALERVRDGAGGGLLRARAAFAEALIVHRFGLSDRPIALPAVDAQDQPVGVGALAFASVRPGPGRRDRALKAIKRDLPWFDVGKQDVHEVQCGPRLLEVAIDKDFLGSDGTDRLSRGPGTPAVVAMQDLEYDDFYPGLIALSQPAGQDRVTVRLNRLTGEAVYIGEAAVRKGEVELDLRAADEPGVAPLAGRVRITSKGVEISGVSDRRTAPKRHPRREE
jgi:HEAT repeats